MKSNVVVSAVLATSVAAPPSPTASVQQHPTASMQPNFELKPTIALASTRHDPTVPAAEAIEIYVMDSDGTNLRRLTENTDGDVFAILSPDGKKIVFDSNRNRASGEPINTSDLFLMDTDGNGQTFLTRGSTATWSPDSKNIAFHASASGTGTPIRPDPGAPTTDSDIFVANVDDLLDGVETPRNLTNTPDHLDDDADWSPDGARIVYSRYDIIPGDPVSFSTSDIYVLNVTGTGQPTRLTDTARNERSPEWSPDGSRIVYMCPSNDPTITTFEICVINADGDEKVQLTNNTVGDLGPHWSPDGQHIVLQRPVGPGSGQLFVITPDDIDPNDPADPDRIGTQITNSAGTNLIADWGELRVHQGKETT